MNKARPSDAMILGKLRPLQWARRDGQTEQSVRLRGEVPDQLRNDPVLVGKVIDELIAQGFRVVARFNDQPYWLELFWNPRR